MNFKELYWIKRNYIEFDFIFLDKMNRIEFKNLKYLLKFIFIKRINKISVK